MTRPCASRTLLSSCLRGQCRLTLWGTLDARAEPTWPRQAFSSIAAMYPVLASATAPAISGALSTRPNVDGVAGRIQRSELLHRVTPCGLSTVHEGTPFVRGCLRDGRQRWGRCIQATRTAGFRRAACAHTGAVHGPVIRSPTRSAGVSMDAK